MNETLYKELEPTKTIELALPLIIDSFVEFYGEEKRNDIVSKLTNVIIIGYGLPDCLNNILLRIKDNFSNELIDEFFNEINVLENKEELKNKFFSRYDLEFINLLPIQFYVEYLDIDKDDLNIKLKKERAVTFLKQFNSEVTIENLDELQNLGAFKDIEKLIPTYKLMLEKYKIKINDLEEYEKQVKLEETNKRKLREKYWLKLLDEFAYLIPKEELEDIKNTYEKYGYTKTTKTVSLYFGNNLIGVPPIAAFNEENEKLLLSGREWQKESVTNDRIKFFNDMGINLGKDYELYKNNPECINLIPSEELIKKILSRKQELDSIMNNHYYNSTNEYVNNKKRIDSYDLLDKDDNYNANAYFNHSTFVSPNVKLINGEYHSKPILCFYTNILEYLDVSLIHELNHVFELNLTKTYEDGCEFSCGWDILEGKFNNSTNENISLERRKEKRKYELFNEIINEVIAQEITSIMHKKNNYIFNTKENAKINGGTSYEHTLFLVRDFYEMYKKEILETRTTRNMQPLFDKVGKENFDLLNNLFHEFYENFGGLTYYTLIDDLNKKKDTELTKKFYELIQKRDNVLINMNEYSSEYKNINAK